MQQLYHPSRNLYKKNRYRSKYGLQHGVLAHTEQQATKAPKNDMCKTIHQTGKSTV